jgi:solute carrier family 32 (vesicular inhibitory amino acid transporter)
MAAGSPDEESTLHYGRGDVFSPNRTSLLRQHLEASPPQRDDRGESSAAEHPKNHAVDFRDRERKALDTDLALAFHGGSGRTRRSSSIFAVPPHLATPSLTGSYGSYRGSIGGYGTVEDSAGASNLAQAQALWEQQQEAGANVPDGELEPILVKEVEEDGRIKLTVEGQSTLPQTIFNSIKQVTLRAPIMSRL